MFAALTFADLAEHPNLGNSMFEARKAQFIDRHGWDLRSNANGFEYDEYDDPTTVYCIVSSGGRHRASARLVECSRRSMTKDHFPSLWASMQTKQRRGTEVTRLCTDPDLDWLDRKRSVSDLLLGLCRHCLSNSIASLYGVVFPSVHRVLKQAGWEGLIIAKDAGSTRPLLLCEWFASELVAWKLQDRRSDLEFQQTTPPVPLPQTPLVGLAC